MSKILKIGVDNKSAFNQNHKGPLLRSEKAETNLSPQVEKWGIEISQMPCTVCPDDVFPSISFIVV